MADALPGIELELVEQAPLEIPVPALVEGADKAQVLADPHPLQQTVLLVHHADPGQLGRTQPMAGGAKGRAGARRRQVESDDMTHERGLAAAVAADEADDRMAGKRQVHAVEGSGA